ncbi:hypothetical protein QTN47_03995 [Danxiaibacter flavus]|uniref:ATP-grasp domain-containing protein n=1 Tax=Danxiaibacter flavus TaxID=3049108 RepID=A0ABV3ZBM9_9BACT|nr:hypothetical protein QNM32_03995 [Chitinophagaceae bacterium DXS]
MKKIGIIYGQERTFPQGFVEYINRMNLPDIVAESVNINKVEQGAPSPYAVIVDRISHDVPFYRAYLKNAALNGTAVINNPFWWSADEKFFNNCLATKINVPVPKTVILPSHDMPEETTEESFNNLSYPLEWNSIFEYIGFPAYMKPFAGGGWKSVYKLEDTTDFFSKYAETGRLVMLLQEEIVFTEYYRCYCVGGKHVHIMPYEPRNPHHLRYSAGFTPSEQLYKEMESIVLRINQNLGYDFNTVELAIRDGVPYAIDFCNPAPDADRNSVGEENFAWVVEAMGNFAIEKAKAFNPGNGANNLTWGAFVKHSVHAAEKNDEQNI